MDLTDQILNTVKRMLGLDTECTEYDIDIIVHINSCFARLHQMGVGPEIPFAISDSKALWIDFMPDPKLASYLGMVKTYVEKRVKLAFDPPTASYLIDEYRKQIAEDEWRLNFEFDAIPYAEKHLEGLKDVE